MGTTEMYELRLQQNNCKPITPLVDLGRIKVSQTMWLPGLIFWSKVRTLPGILILFLFLPNMQDMHDEEARVATASELGQ